MDARLYGVTHFVNGHEMGGYYAAHLLDMADFSKRPRTQVGLLGVDAEGARTADEVLRRYTGEQIFDALREHVWEASGIAVARLSPGRHRRHVSIMVQSFDRVSGVDATFLLSARRSRMTERLLADEPSLVDLAGVNLGERELARLDVCLAFDAGLQRYALAYAPVSLTAA